MKEEGFSLIELLVVVVIMAVIAIVALPAYQQKVAQARQNEAKAQLMAVWQAMEVYKLQYGVYPDTLAKTNFSFNPMNTTGRNYYTCSITAHTDTTFTATATGNIDSDSTMDVWTIQQDGTLQNTTNDVSG